MPVFRLLQRCYLDFLIAYFIPCHFKCRRQCIHNFIQNLRGSNTSVTSVQIKIQVFHKRLFPFYWTTATIRVFHCPAMGRFPSSVIPYISNCPFRALIPTSMAMVNTIFRMDDYRNWGLLFVKYSMRAFFYTRSTFRTFLNINNLLFSVGWTGTSLTGHAHSAI